MVANFFLKFLFAYNANLSQGLLFLCNVLWQSIKFYGIDNYI